MDTLTKEVCMPLGKYMKGFPAVHRLHPFEIAMLELTCGTAPYEQALSRIDSLRKSLLQVHQAPQMHRPSTFPSEGCHWQG